MTHNPTKSGAFSFQTEPSGGASSVADPLNDDIFATLDFEEVLESMGPTNSGLFPSADLDAHIKVPDHFSSTRPFDPLDTNSEEPELAQAAMSWADNTTRSHELAQQWTPAKASSASSSAQPVQSHYHQQQQHHQASSHSQNGYVTQPGDVSLSGAHTHQQPISQSAPTMSSISLHQQPAHLEPQHQVFAMQKSSGATQATQRNNLLQSYLIQQQMHKQMQNFTAFSQQQQQNQPSSSSTSATPAAQVHIAQPSVNVFATPFTTATNPNNASQLSTSAPSNNPSGFSNNNAIPGTMVPNTVKLQQQQTQQPQLLSTLSGGQQQQPFPPPAVQQTQPDMFHNYEAVGSPSGGPARRRGSRPIAVAAAAQNAANVSTGSGSPRRRGRAGTAGSGTSSPLMIAHANAMPSINRSTSAGLLINSGSFGPGLSSSPVPASPGSPFTEMIMPFTHLSLANESSGGATPPLTDSVGSASSGNLLDIMNRLPPHSNTTAARPHPLSTSSTSLNTIVTNSFNNHNNSTNAHSSSQQLLQPMQQSQPTAALDPRLHATLGTRHSTSNSPPLSPADTNVISPLSHGMIQSPHSPQIPPGSHSESAPSSLANSQRLPKSVSNTTFGVQRGVSEDNLLPNLQQQQQQQQPQQVTSPTAPMLHHNLPPLALAALTAEGSSSESSPQQSPLRIPHDVRVSSAPHRPSPLRSRPDESPRTMTGTTGELSSSKGSSRGKQRSARGKTSAPASPAAEAPAMIVGAPGAPAESSSSATNSPRNNPKKRAAFSDEQTSIMNKHFADKEGANFSASEIAAIAQEVNLTEHQVRIYFQNRRARSKAKQQKERERAEQTNREAGASPGGDDGTGSNSATDETTGQKSGLRRRSSSDAPLARRVQKRPPSSLAMADPHSSTLSQSARSTPRNVMTSSGTKFDVDILADDVVVSTADSLLLSSSPSVMMTLAQQEQAPYLISQQQQLTSDQILQQYQQLQREQAAQLSYLHQQQQLQQQQQQQQQLSGATTPSGPPKS